MPSNYIQKHLPKYALYKYINKKILGATVKKLLYDLYWHVCDRYYSCIVFSQLHHLVLPCHNHVIVYIT